MLPALVPPKCALWISAAILFNRMLYVERIVMTNQSPLDNRI